MPLTLADVIDPHGSGSFLSETMGISALYIEGRPSKFRDLFSWSVVNHLLEYGGLTFPRLRLVNGEHEVPVSNYMRVGVSGYPRLVVPEFSAALRKGAMFAISAVDELHEPVGRLCQNLEESLEVPVQADMYASWPNASPSLPQWSSHEALVLQIDGGKRWQLFYPTTPFPIESSSAAPPTEPSAWEGTLQANDVLYIPRGWWYSDGPVQEPVLYLVVTFTNPTCFNLAQRVVNSLVWSEAMRNDYPRFASPEHQGSALTSIQSQLINACQARD
jgi:hypothetical protein